MPPDAGESRLWHCATARNWRGHSMEQQDGGSQAEPNEDDDGFTMEFKIEVVDNVEAQVEEMVRLGALGYFKEARQLSQSIAPEHQSTFEVVFEQLRLMLDQGAYTDLIAKAKSHTKETWSSAQSTLLSLMVAIAHLSMNGAEESQVSDALKESQLVDPVAICAQLQVRLKVRSWSIQEIILSLRLWYLGRIDEPQPTTTLDERTRAYLLDAAFSLLEQEQFWAAKTVFQVSLLDGLFDDDAQVTRSRRISIEQALQRIPEVDMSAFESRLTLIGISEKVYEESILGLYTQYSKGIVHPGVKNIRILTREVRLQLAQTRRGLEDSGPRCAMYKTLAGLLDEHVFRGLSRPGRMGVEYAALAAEQVKRLRDQADYYDDRATHKLI